MDLEKIQALMNQFEDSDLCELKIDDGDFHFYLSKNKNKISQQPIVKSTNPIEKTEQAKAFTPKFATQNAKSVKAPIVGIVYLQAKPDQPAFVKIGDHVNKGDTICIIEAMKMMTEVKSDLTGTVTGVKVENEDLVEVGQPLITVEED
ncbi:acetyl-CoA carboxylase biotin carboxyl carrier protein [Lactobacillus amylovorus]|uniref:acetyl-CoA carboxylase biotin carboxyl carrier protein n=1 Tax=Lactobacillus amylovorus TaxID=1604 RepID=UPI003CFEA875